MRFSEVLERMVLRASTRARTVWPTFSVMSASEPPVCCEMSTAVEKRRRSRLPVRSATLSSASGGLDGGAHVLGDGPDRLGDRRARAQVRRDQRHGLAQLLLELLHARVAAHLEVDREADRAQGEQDERYRAEAEREGDEGRQGRRGDPHDLRLLHRQLRGRLLADGRDGRRDFARRPLLGGLDAGALACDALAAGDHEHGDAEHDARHGGQKVHGIDGRYAHIRTPPAG